jgi:hypothetical protein
MKFGFLKYFSLIALFAMTFSASNAYAQARPSPATQVVSVDFIPLVIDYPMTLQYEFKADPVSSWVLRLHFWPGLSADYTGFGFGAAYRFYIADSRAPAADIYLFHQSAQLGGTGSRSAVGIDLGGDLAYKWIFDQFAVEPIVGLRFGFGSSTTPSALTTIWPIIGCSLGYAW